ncbi:MAG: cupin domain-containing protein [Elusimicrobiota bacterium]
MKPHRVDWIALPVRMIGDLAIRSLPVDKTGFPVSVLHSALAPYSMEGPVVHERTSEFVFVIQGEAEAELDGRKLRLRRGDSLQIPAGTAHAFRTEASGVEALSVFSPALDAERPDAKLIRRRRTRAAQERP